jgi:hypothetical protein
MSLSIFFLKKATQPYNIKLTRALYLCMFTEQTLSLHPIGKPMPNKRGRKPLTTMPSAVSHKINSLFENLKLNKDFNARSHLTEFYIHFFRN